MSWSEYHVFVANSTEASLPMLTNDKLAPYSSHHPVSARPG